MIVYFSGATNLTHRFVSRLETTTERIPLRTSDAATFTVDEEFVLITPTYESKSQGFLPRQVAKFLNIPSNREKMVGVIGSGNLGFGDDFAVAADRISEKTGVPLLYKFELAGTDEDVDKVTRGLESFWQTKLLTN